MVAVAFYPGSFDPMTNGHVAMLMAALAAFDRVVIGIGTHPTKAGYLPAAARERIIEEVASDLGGPARVDIVTFEGLVVEAARANGANVLVRGLRDGTDLDYEMQMAGMNAVLAPDVRTVFLPATADTRHVTATLVRQIASMGGDVSPFVPAPTLAALAARAK